MEATNTKTYVKGVGLDSVLAYAERRFGRERVAAKLAELEAAHGAFEGHRLTSAHVPLATAVAAWQAVDSLLDGPPSAHEKLWREIGRYVAESNLSGVYKAMLGLLVNPERLAKRIPSLWTTYFVGPVVDLDTSELSKGVVRAEVQGFGYAPFINAMGAGWLVYAFELVGGKDVVVEEEALSAGRLVSGRTLRYVHRWKV